MNWLFTRLLAMDNLCVVAVAAFSAILVYALFCAVRGSGACRTFLNESEEEGELHHV